MNDYVDLDDLDTKTFRISWENIDSGARAIASNVLQNPDKPEAIVCKQFDVIPASIVARILELPLCIVHPNPRAGSIIIDSVPRFSKTIRSGEYHQPKPRIAIVCSIVDNDDNVDDLMGFYSENNPKVLSIYSRKNTKNPPDYRWVLIAHGTNCIFPWEEK